MATLSTDLFLNPDSVREGVAFPRDQIEICIIHYILFFSVMCGIMIDSPSQSYIQ